MTVVLRTLGICLGFFLILSITVKDKSIFNHIYSLTSHVTIPAQDLTVSLFDKAADSTTAYTKKLFDNSVPKVRDTVKAKVAAPVRGKLKEAPPEEVILVEEKEELDDLIKSHQ